MCAGRLATARCPRPPPVPSHDSVLGPGGPPVKLHPLQGPCGGSPGQALQGASQDRGLAVSVSTCSVCVCARRVCV